MHTKYMYCTDLKPAFQMFDFVNDTLNNTYDCAHKGIIARILNAECQIKFCSIQDYETCTSM